jgi:sugar O-acyltransferase (sialic acid O-acetyltransferase NeuD family)
MILVGAGGQALEVYDISLALGKTNDLEAFDQDMQKLSFRGRYSILHDPEALLGTAFCLGIGSPSARKKIYELLMARGKSHVALRGDYSLLSPSASFDQADIFHRCFIGPEVHLGIGCLINSGAQIHHEVKVGHFSVINPGEILLGASQIGDFCAIGTHAAILPGIHIGNHVTIGAGAVIIRDVEDGQTVVGVPGREVGGQ